MISRRGPLTDRLFELAHGQDDPDPSTRARIGRALSAKIGAGAGLTAIGVEGAARAASSASMVAKVLPILGVAAALVTGGGFLAVRTSQPSATTPGAPPQTASVAQIAPAVRAQGATPPDPPTSPGQAPPAEAPLRTTRARARSASRMPPRPAAPPPSSADLPASAGADALRAEAEALRVAQQALRDEAPERALSLLDEQDARFQHGQLQEERAAARVLALCQAGRVAEARAQALSFEQAWPRSPLFARMQSACWGR